MIGRERATVFLLWWAAMALIWWIGAPQIPEWTPGWMRARVQEETERIVIISRSGALPLHGGGLMMLAFGVYGVLGLMEDGFSWTGFLLVFLFLSVGLWGLAGLGGAKVILRQGELQKESGLLLRWRAPLESGLGVSVGLWGLGVSCISGGAVGRPVLILSFELAGVEMKVLAKWARATRTERF